jgi:benzoyl-CoA reductase/2-hydroxyglutaryl-CoA dehydratase subunit BcrC/BadD/HgdB
MEKVRAKDLLKELLDKHYEEAWDAKKNGVPVGWVASNFPQEFIEAMGLTVVYPENQTAAISAKKESMKMLEISEQLGYSNDICGYARVSLAYAHVEECESLNMPQPDYMLCCNNICNQLMKWFETIAAEKNIPLILFDVPFNNEYEVTQSRLDYMKKQSEYMIGELEKISGKKFERKRLEEVMELSNECGMEWRRAQKYAEAKPSPINGFDMFNYMALMVCARGRKDTLEAIRLFADEMEEKYNNGETSFRGEEKHRILMEGIACWPKLRHNYKQLAEHGINMAGTVYTDTWGRVYKDFDEMLISYGLVLDNLNLERATERRVNIIKRAKCDGIIVHMNRSCKIWDGFLYEMDRRMQEETGVPSIMYDGDQADPRCYSEAQFETRIQGISEVMGSRKESEGE